MRLARPPAGPVGAEEPVPEPAVPAAESEGGGRRHASGDVALAVATLATVAPILVAAVRGAGRGWLPVGDDAYTAIRGHDVFSHHLPLLGTWSSASKWTGHQFNHPGPLQFDVAAVPVRLLGPGWGVALATAAVNVACLIAVAWLARRLVGARAATVAMVFAVGLVWAIGSEVLYDPWSQYAPLFPFLAFLFAAWATAAGRASALPVAVAAGSYALQAHLSYVVLVPVLGAWAVAGLALGLARARRTDPGGWPEHRRRQLRWAGIGLATLALCWAQPLWQQFTAEPGNLGELLASAGVDGPPGPGWKGAVEAVGHVVGLPPLWLPPGWASPPWRVTVTTAVGPVPLLPLGALVVLLALGAAIATAARRSADRTATTGLATVAVATAGALASVTKSSITIGWFATYSYVRWLWPISMFAWTVLVVAGVRTASARGWLRISQRQRARIAAGAAGLAVVVAALALPTVDNGTAAPRWAMPVAREISRQAVPRLAGRGPVLVRLPLSQPSFAVGPAVFYELARHGIEFVVDDPDLVAQLGSDRRFDGTNAAVVVTLLAGDAALNPPPGIERIAFAPGLDSSERQAKREAELRIAATLAASGSPRLLLDPRKVAALDPVFREGLVLVLREDLPDLARRAAAGDLPALVALIETDLVDDDRFPGVDLARWAKLHRRAETRATALVVEPLP